MTKSTPTPASHDPHNHSVRDQILDAAMARFSRYGYEKTAVTDLAKAIGFSGAYICKFFDSKQAIGEATCANRLGKTMVAVNAAIADAPFASEELRRLLRALIEAGSELSFGDRKLYDTAAIAAHDKWPLTEQYTGHLQQLIGQILAGDRQTGEFGRETPLNEATLAVYIMMCPLINPVQLQYNLDTAPTAMMLLASLILRSLSP